jgi:hypothetical protein
MAGRRTCSQLFVRAQLWFRLMNKAGQQNKQLAFVFLISSGTGQTEHKYRHIAKASTLAVSHM